MLSFLHVSDRGYHRHRRHRPPTLGQRLYKWLEMPRLPRRQRNERIAIVLAVLVVALYIVISPFVNRYLGSSKPSAPVANPASTRLPKLPKK
jgi:hypothetical protein